MRHITVKLTEDQVKTVKKALIEYARHNVDNEPHEQEYMFMLRLVNKFDS